MTLLCCQKRLLVYRHSRNSLKSASSSLQLKVNITKSYIFVLERVVTWGQGKDGRMLVLYCHVYKYFGVFFSTKLNFTASCCALTSKAKNAVLCIMQKLRMLSNNSFELFLTQTV